MLSYVLVTGLLTNVYIFCDAQVDPGLQAPLCYGWCIAKCQNNKVRTNNTDCSYGCLPYNRSDLCSSDACWNRCSDLKVDPDGGIPISPSSPTVRQGNQDGTPNPYNIVIKFLLTNARVYVIQYMDVSEQTWHALETKTISPNEVSLAVESMFTRPFLCHSYAFRVIPINEKMIGKPSSVATSKEADVIYATTPRIQMTSVRRVDDNIVVVIGYDPPAGWSWTLYNASFTIRPYSNYEGISPENITIEDKSQLIATLSLTNYRASFFVSDINIVTICGTKYPFEDIPLFSLTNYCEMEEGEVVCQESDLSKKCSSRMHRYTDLYWNKTVAVVNPELCADNRMNIEITWDPIKLPNGCSFKRVIIRYGLKKLENSDLGDSIQIYSMVSETVVVLDQRVDSFKLPNRRVEELNGFQVFELHTGDNNAVVELNKGSAQRESVPIDLADVYCTGHSKSFNGETKAQKRGKQFWRP